MWQKKDKDWYDYPEGTRAKRSWTGGTYVKTKHGWKFIGGSTFPTPGDSDVVLLINKGQDNVYEGQRMPTGSVVTVNGEPLDPKLDVINHSPTGFEWGYSGSGPAQLALAIMINEFGDKDDYNNFHPCSYQELKDALIATITTDRFTLTSQQIQDWLRKYELGL